MPQTTDEQRWQSWGRRLIFLGSMQEGYRYHLEPHMLDLDNKLKQFFHARGKDLEWGAGYSRASYIRDHMEDLNGTQ
jgi:hypothetical protein